MPTFSGTADAALPLPPRFSVITNVPSPSSRFHRLAASCERTRRCTNLIAPAIVGIPLLSKSEPSEARTLLLSASSVSSNDGTSGHSRYLHMARHMSDGLSRSKPSNSFRVSSKTFQTDLRNSVCALISAAAATTVDSSPWLCVRSSTAASTRSPHTDIPFISHMSG